MSRSFTLLALALGLTVTGCAKSGIGLGQDPDAAPTGSYSGQTLNSPVTDQNPHVGGDASYPSSVSDQGMEQQPQEK